MMTTLGFGYSTTHHYWNDGRSRRSSGAERISRCMLQFAVPNSPYSLLDNRFNTYLLSFWRLHGWIDDVWTRFRAARGLGMTTRRCSSR